MRMRPGPLSLRTKPGTRVLEGVRGIRGEYQGIRRSTRVLEIVR